MQDLGLVHTERNDAETASLRTLEGELLVLIARQARRVPLLTLGTTGLLAVLLLQHLPLQYVLCWYAVIVITALLKHRIVCSLPDQNQLSEDLRLRIAAAAFTVHGFFLALAMAAFPFVPLVIGAVLSIYNIGMAAATLHAVMGYSRIYIPYCVMAVAPVVLAWSFTPNLDGNLLDRMTFAGMASIFLFTMLGHARGTFGLFADAHRMRRERLGLTRRLSDALHRAEAANNAKTRFLASASHDLRQPIHALSLFSGALSMRPLDARTTAIAEQIDKAVTVMGSQLDALLDISRLDAGVVEKNLAVLHLRALLVQLHQEFLPQADRKRLVLILDCTGDPLVRSDPALLQSVLRNLVSNAIKYTQQGSVLLRATVQDEVCRISVIDTGWGIPLAEQSRVFEEFYQLHNPARDRSMGLGLGLAIVRRLTELLDIELNLHSVPGEGTRFDLLLPRGSGPVSRPPPEDEADPAQVPLRVLVIDDEEAIRSGMSTLLAEMGFEVRVAASTREAEALADHFTPAVLLADFRLGRNDDGLKAIETLRRRWPGIPALLISGDTAPDRLLQARDAGVPLLHKPVSAGQLRKVILDTVGP